MQTYTWKGLFEYKPATDGKKYWFFCDRTKWTSPLGGYTETVTFVNKVLSQWDTIEKAFEEKNGIFTESSLNPDFLCWLSGPKDDLKVLRAIALCLDNFARSENLLETNNRIEYSIISSIVGPDITVDIRGLARGKPCWFYLHSEKTEIWREEFGEYLV